MNNNKYAVTVTIFITVAFLIAGIFDVLNYFIVKLILFLSFLVLLFYMIYYLLVNQNKKHPRD